MGSSDKVTQAGRILGLLTYHTGKWVPLTRILELGIASHTRRIHELRKRFTIEKREEYVGKWKRRVWYRLVRP